MAFKLSGDIVNWGIAAVIGGAIAIAVNKFASKKIHDYGQHAVNSLAYQHPNAATAIGVATGVIPTMSRAFPDRSNLFNSIPSPMVEHLVPFDVAGRWAKVTGAYDRCDALIFP